MGTTPDLAGEFAKASIVANDLQQRRCSGMTVIEAMACGVPVVAFDGASGARASSWPTGHNGVLVPEGDGEIEAYAAALLALIDDERRRRLLAAGALEAATGTRRPRWASSGRS